MVGQLCQTETRLTILVMVVSTIVICKWKRSSVLVVRLQRTLMLVLMGGHLDGQGVGGSLVGHDMYGKWLLADCYIQLQRTLVMISNKGHIYHRLQCIPQQPKSTH